MTAAVAFLAGLAGAAVWPFWRSPHSHTTSQRYGAHERLQAQPAPRSQSITPTGATTKRRTP